MSYTANVRYGKILLVGRFKTDRVDLKASDPCIVRTDRGKEVGRLISPPTPIPEGVSVEGLGEIIRHAGVEDLTHADRIEKESVPRAKQVCKELVTKLNLPMKLLDVDIVFGGERIIFYFSSDTRVDFRELVRKLAQEFRTRIELKQVGARDEARLTGDCGHCGCGLCCRGFLKELGGIGMEMAKVQKHTSDPFKVTGRCGKLMCCLRYEHGAYMEAKGLVPPKGRRVETAQGVGIVVDQDLLQRRVAIEVEGGERKWIGVDEIVNASAPPPPPVPAPVVSAPPPPAVVAAPKPVRSPVWVRIGAVSDFQPGAGRVVDLEGVVLAVFNVSGAIHVIENACPHQGGPLGEGKLEGGVVTCPVHQWQFDVSTGRSLSVGGACARTYEVKVDGEDVFVKV